MTSAYSFHPHFLPEAPRTAPLSAIFPVVVAITSDSAAPAAIRIAHILAQECGAIPTVLRVVQKLPPTGADTSGVMGGVLQSTLTPMYRDPDRSALERRVREVLGAVPLWHYDIEVGEPVPTIVKRVKEARAELTILGLPPHNFLRRAFLRDTVQGVLEQTQTAVLAVRPELTSRPKSILVAVDFSSASLRAAHLAAQLVDPNGHITLLHVQLGESYAQIGVELAFSALIEDLTSETSATITSVVEHGNPMVSVQAVAERVHFDLIALGARHHSAIDWFFGDSVSTELVHDRRWSLLLVPE